MADGRIGVKHLSAKFAKFAKVWEKKPSSQSAECSDKDPPAPADYGLQPFLPLAPLAMFAFNSSGMIPPA